MKEIKKLIVALPLDEAGMEALRALLPQAQLLDRREEQATREDVLSADAIFGNVPPRLLEGAENLLWVQLASAGSDAYAPLVPQGTELCNATGAYGDTIAEFMLAGALALQKHLCGYRDNMREGRWQNLGGVRLMSESCCLVLGLGDIGGGFAARAKALGAYVIGVRRSLRDKPNYVDELHTMEQLDELLPRADIIAMSLPNGAATTGVIDARRLALMKPEAILINVGRGGAIVTEDLLDALREGRLGGALLDVTEPEPLPPEHPLWKQERVLITPHCSGNWSNPLIMRRVMEIFAENLSRLSKGEPLINRVDRRTGYRAL